MLKFKRQLEIRYTNNLILHYAEQSITLLSGGFFYGKHGISCFVAH